eukprot:372135_1
MSADGEQLQAGTWPLNKEMGLDTKLVHAGTEPDPLSGAILTPIYQTTTYVQDSVEKYLAKGYSYSRSDNPTVSALEKRVAELEGAAGVVCVTSGMAATCTVFLCCLQASDHCVITSRSYGGTNRAARVQFTKLGMTFSFVDFSNLEEVENAIKPNTKMLFSEVPSNPTLNLADLRAISDLAKRHGLLHACDSTFATPLMIRPLDHGTDIVVQSLTKFYDGQNVAIGGAIASSTKELNEQMRLYSNINGNLMVPQTAFYILQAVKTMRLRFQKQCQTAQHIAEMLEKHPKVEKVCYPGLKSFAQKELAEKQHLNGLNGSMLWFEVYGGTEAGTRLMNSVPRPWSLCENLGATESIITCPSVMTHGNMLKEDRLKVGITDGFVRVSCGIEDTQDLLSTLSAALDRV